MTASAPSRKRTAYQFVVPNSELAPKTGRDLIATLLAITGHTPLIDAARLCVSEVITHSYLHTRTARLHLDVSVRPGHVSVAVRDDEWGQRPASASGKVRLDESRGRGFLLLTRLSAEWGVVTWPAEEEEGMCKRVWFTLGETELTA
ncbi:ATP-binding protein [Streptomyces sp. NPDC088196]|uniref:ATP-binding protein n=1 Tax=Streptomyces sp. NPDC088196 TaxID=3154868 RepID=UPI00344D9784